MRLILRLMSTLGTLLLMACANGDRAPLAPSATYPTVFNQLSAIVSSSVPDVSGTWLWDGGGHITVPASVVERLFGIEPEGPITHLRCETSGTMELVQTGATFSGVATRTAGSCTTGAGLAFVPPPAAWPTSLPVAEGQITGRGVHFLLGTIAGLGCPHNGAISNVEAGRATELTANGRCIVPGQPSSPAPLDPPPLGTSHDTSFVARRP